VNVTREIVQVKGNKKAAQIRVKAFPCKKCETDHRFKIDNTDELFSFVPWFLELHVSRKKMSEFISSLRDFENRRLDKK